MMPMVHRQRRDAVALAHPQPGQRRGETARIDARLAPRRSRHAAVGPARHDLSPRMFARGMVDQAGDEERLALHSHLSARSEEHTSELQSLMRISYAVFCLKKKTQST